LVNELAKYLQHQSQKSVGMGEKLLDSSSSSSSASGGLVTIFLPTGRDISGEAAVWPRLMADSDCDELD